MSSRSLQILAVWLVLILFSAVPASAAFHTGGVGSCSGCHVTHAASGVVSAKLLASDPGSICLNCHAGPGAADNPSVFSFDGSALTPGGDFYWLTRTFTWTGGSSPAARHGHNVVARDYALDSDPDLPQSPGGSYPATQLSCISCHDPHGRSGGGTRAGAPAASVSGSYGEVPAVGTGSSNYRLLGSVGYSSNGYTFNNPAPVARANPVSPFSESDASHIDYGSGMSEWCANCHSAILTNEHQVGELNFEHPVGGNEAIDAEIIANYNSYLKTGVSGGSAASSYLQFVPFERGTGETALLDPTDVSGPDSNANLSCLTCHRAHASAFRVASRWDFDAPVLIDSHPALGDSGASATDVANSYYGRNLAVEFGTGQGQFCEKCHSGGTP